MLFEVFKVKFGPDLKYGIVLEICNCFDCAYATTNEVSGTGYTAGGEDLTVVAPTTSGTTAFIDFSNVTWHQLP